MPQHLSSAQANGPLNQFNLNSKLGAVQNLCDISWEEGE